MKIGLRFSLLEINTSFIIIILIGLPNCHEKKNEDARFSFPGFHGKSNKDIFIFNNYSFVPLIARKFLGKKYNKYFLILFIILTFLGIFYGGYF